jgi:Acetyltransferase (GNAT) domain
MTAGLNITYLSHAQVDKLKWDTCIDAAANGLVYAYSCYLDAMAQQWDALVLNDYEAVMPLPWRKKYGIHYLYQPFLTAQLGVFGGEMNAALLAAFMEAIPAKFSYWDIYLNHDNFFPSEKYPLYQRTNYVLDLSPGYEDLYKNFRENTRRNIKRATQLGCRVEKNIPAGAVVALAKTQLQHITNADEQDYERFLQLYAQLAAKGKATTCGVYLNGALLASCIYFFSHKRAYYILVGNHPNGKTAGASHLLISAFISDYAGKDLLLDFEGSDIRNLAFFYSGFGATEEKFAGLKLNRLPWWARWAK